MNASTLTKTLNILKIRLLLPVILLISIQSFAQLHEENGCANNYSLDWSNNPSSANEYDWSPNGSISNTFNNVDNSGIDMDISFTGDTYAFRDWNFFGGPNTPNIDNIATNGGDDVLHLFTSGYTNRGITMTITFSEPVYGLAYDMYHVNAGGSNGDKYTITATNTLGEIIYPEFTESANPSYTTNNVGIINANRPSTSGDNAQVGLNFYDENYITSITMLWQDCNTCRQGFVHGSALGKISFCTPQELDFDGNNDYISRTPFLGGNREVTMMSWIKLDNDISGSSEIMGQRNFRLFIDNNRRLNAFVKTNNNIGTNAFFTPNSQAPTLETELWYHVTTTYNGITDELIVYLNGEESHKIENLNGGRLRNNDAWNANHDFEIGRNTFNDNNHFKGSIIEARVYNIALDSKQIQEQVYQEIENHNGNVRGTVIKNEIENLNWTNLRLYYKLKVTNSRIGTTPDASNLSSDGALRNMRTRQDINAPLPYIANQNGDWYSESVWEHGNVWDIDNTKHKDWAIVKIENNVKITTSDNHKHLGLILENNSKLTVNNDQFIQNNKYLKLNGVIDLQGESQLIQTEDSKLEVTSNGFLELDQQGTADSYTYNYWSLPVSAINTIENNRMAPLNSIIMDGTDADSPLEINFQAPYQAADNGVSNPIILSNYWIYQFHGTEEDYNSWEHVGSSNTLKVGEGYTMKGSGIGNVTDKQNYVFRGKPNNGTIDLNIDSGEQYLLGNPYPSAIDANAFIRDNISFINGGNQSGLSSSIDGTLYFWDHFGGGSHILQEYQGGYATYNLSGGVRAISHPSVSQEGVGVKRPDGFIPVAQGFFVQASDGGPIAFNNSQRTYKLEKENESIFFRNSTTQNSTENIEDNRIKLRLEYNVIDGISRELLVTVDEFTTFNYDNGYDGESFDTTEDDLTWLIEDSNYIIQGVPNIDNNTLLPLSLKQSETNEVKVSLLSSENIPDTIEILFEDIYSGEIINLRDLDYINTIEAGEFNDRFVVKFMNNETLSIDDKQKETGTIKVINNSDRSLSLINSNPTNQMEHYTLYSILGQQVKKGELNSEQSTISTETISDGIYVINITTNQGKLSKKIIVK